MRRYRDHRTGGLSCYVMGAGFRCVKVIKDVGEIILPFIHVDDIILALCHVMWKSLEAECQIVMRLLDAFVGSRLVTLEHSLKLLDLACHQDLPSMEGMVFIVKNWSHALQ